MYVAPLLSFFFSRCFLVLGVVAEWWFNQKKAFTDLTYTLSLPRCAIVFKVYVYIYIHYSISTEYDGLEKKRY